MIPPVLEIILAVLLDQLWGDPRWLPHPVRGIGALGSSLENFFRKTGLPLKVAGILTLLLMLAASGGIVLLLLYSAQSIHPFAGTAMSIIILYTTIAARDLARHSNAVYAALQIHDLSEARRRVAMIVGRETDKLSEEEIARAAVESVAESMVDGVCAPLFYAFVGGPAAAMLYKAINTADSMFGYKNDRYREFGWAAARLDDLANFIPARLTGLLVPLAALLLGFDAKSSWHIFWRDRKNHSSPNSGHGESAVAGALGIRLGGSSTYFGRVVVKPTIGDGLQQISAAHIPATNRLMLVTMSLTLLLLSLFSFLPLLR
ncbi:MAG: adenosylcobinamide-phosphate synthase CbiB [Proteobacteria bacterium]|nr:adenosylcobinamide-phosphate synthase CbiB [Pseudomonadota bacterium]MBU4296840.1 adenosylcobinamide-phosphate synthase CbiB [Pseudomonadota bacterium]MCG2748980.1 adenosylcobinamide-phosphate synthase CbiB [Desulfobulbaceae bacterium]